MPRRAAMKGNARSDGATPAARQPRHLSAVAKANIEAVAEMEREHLRRRSRTEALSDAVARYSGSFTFFTVNAVLFGGWVFVNVGGVPGLQPFDPYPFTFLTLMVSLEAIFLSIFVLANQNRMAQQADHWAHLNLQVDLLSEQETTKTLRMLQAIADHLGVKREAHDAEAERLAEQTKAKTLMRELKQSLPDS